MKKILFTLAVLAMVLVSCSEENLIDDIQVEPVDNGTFTVSVTMPGGEEDAKTRVSLTPDADAGYYGLELKWEENDKLMLCFEQNGNYYHNDALIVSSSISSNGITAQFTITVPSEIPANANFNLYGVYQKTDNDDTNGGYFEEDKYILEENEEGRVTLDDASPMLYFSQTNIENSSEPAIAPFSLKHSGWMMALHIENGSSATANLSFINLVGIGNDTWAWNGGATDNVSFDVTTKEFSGAAQNNLLFDNLTGSLGAGESVTFYRWIASEVEVPALQVIAKEEGEAELKTLTNISNKTVTIGNIYHVNTMWGANEATVTTSEQLIAAGTNPAVSTITLGADITLGANLVLSNLAKTVDLNGKTLIVAGYEITASTDDSKLMNGNIEGAAILGGAGTGFSVEDVAFSGALTTSNTASLDNNISFLRGSVEGAITSTNPAKEFDGTALTAAITPGTGTKFKNLTITGAVTASLAANYDNVIFNGAVTAGVGASTFANSIFNAAVTNLSGNSVYTGSTFNGPVTNTNGNADYTNAVFNDALTIVAGTPVFGTASKIVGVVVEPGSVSGSTKITYTPAATNTLKYVKQGEAFEAPLVGTDASTIGVAYTSGADIAEVSASEHIGLYEVTTTNLIVKFVDITLGADDIKAD